MFLVKSLPCYGVAHNECFLKYANKSKLNFCKIEYYGKGSWINTFICKFFLNAANFILIYGGIDVGARYWHLNTLFGEIIFPTCNTSNNFLLLKESSLLKETLHRTDCSRLIIRCEFKLSMRFPSIQKKLICSLREVKEIVNIISCF